ncbi:hypothetical protein COLO4_15390 [Corchorus olitorius]|uniref:LRAT domain-containing protein n=1 Tax=Corchorus olitorius TaxID=93759 RepID=A0A1R3JN02_9ROSI|nr:hypothetical protein COLO4_15390 [Corchorus olitorius]
MGLNTLNPGDHIYSYRQIHTFSHHGIYVGKGTVTKLNNEEVEINDAVIHFMGFGKCSNQIPCEKCGHSSRRIGVAITCLDCFLQGEAQSNQFAGSIFGFGLGGLAAYNIAKGIHEVITED